MQALRKVVQAAVPGTRSMAGAGAQTCEARWAKYFPQPPVSQAQAQKSVRKEMIGFLLLGPASALAMVYDLVFGLVRDGAMLLLEQGSVQRASWRSAVMVHGAREGTST